MDSTLYWLWLAEALGSGCRLAGRLLEEYPDPAELYGQVKAGWNPPEYLSARAREFMQAVAPAQMAGLKKRCDDLNIFILTPDSADYPQRLRDLPDLPLVLYGTGNPACLNGRRYVGMVGTRRPTKYGLSACRDLSLTMAERGVVIVSGLAEGLDGAGHRAAVEAGQQTVAFLGTAINKTFPAVNVTLRAELEALVQADAEAFAPLAAAYGLPKDTPEQAAHKAAVLETALDAACAVPLEIMGKCAEGIALVEEYAARGSALAVSDAGCAAALCKAALQAASLNVFINTKLMIDKTHAAALDAQADALLSEYVPKADTVFAQVTKQLRT